MVRRLVASLIARSLVAESQGIARDYGGGGGGREGPPAGTAEGPDRRPRPQKDVQSPEVQATRVAAKGGG